MLWIKKQHLRPSCTSVIVFSVPFNTLYPLKINDNTLKRLLSYLLGTRAGREGIRGRNQRADYTGRNRDSGELEDAVGQAEKI